MQLISIFINLSIFTVTQIYPVDAKFHKSYKSARNVELGNRRATRGRNTNRITAKNLNGNNNDLNSNAQLKSMRLSQYYGNALTPAPPLQEFEDSESIMAVKDQDATLTRMTATAGTTTGMINYSGATDNSGPTRSPNYYLKAMYEHQEALDDIEIEYANEFLKKGLVLAADFEGGDTWDDKFMMTLKKFYANLMQQSQPFIPDISSKWRAMPGESVYRSQRLYTKQKSVDCGNLSMKLKMTGIIYDGHRNRVIKLLDRGTKRSYAYKTYGNPDEFYVEQEKFLWLDHPYYVNAVCHRKDLESGKAGILFEYIEGVSSMEYARSASIEQLKLMSAQLFLAIEHLHWLGIVHADLKPENVLIRKDGTVQVIDLGFATHLPQSKRRRGTHTTMAPELHYLVPGRVHEAIDWWAYGSTVAIWHGVNYNYKNDDGRTFIPMNWRENQFIDGVAPWRFPQELRNFLQVFFLPDPNSRRIHTKRLLKQIRNDPFFSDIDWSQLHGGVMN